MQAPFDSDELRTHQIDANECTNTREAIERPLQRHIKKILVAVLRSAIINGIVSDSPPAD